MQQQFQGDQGRLHVIEDGEGQPAVLFVHGGAGDVTQWAHQMDALRSEYRVVAVGLRGHGGSDTPRNGDFSVEGLSQDIGQVIAQLGIRPCVLVGHSIGALAALHYAAHHPEDIVGLFLIDPGNDARHLAEEQKQALVRALQEQYQQTSEAYWRTLIGENHQLGIRLMADLRASSPVTVQRELQALFLYDPLPDLDRFRKPVFCLVARSTESPSSLHVLRPDLPHRQVPDSGHWIQLEHPMLVTRALQEFLHQTMPQQRRDP